MSVQGLRIELLTDPGPLRADGAGLVIARIRRDAPAADDSHAGHAAHSAPPSPAMPVIGADVRIALAGSAPV
ncbi:MAG TPA: hypothetical protein VFQ62_14155, partial [Methylomirabilota bacterium]|nr:hypothetical protein [Methylomirabilota bacterium]